MDRLADDKFNELVSEALDKFPEKYRKRVNNVVFVVEDQPSPEQRQKLALSAHQSLFGLYEGIPLTARGNNYNLVLPDKITLFKLPLEMASHSLENLKANIMHTLWHEVGHYFGLNHARIAELEAKYRLEH